MIRSAAERVTAAGMLLLLSPILGAIALGVRLSMGKPVLFRQERTGYKGTPFDLYKFRTMLNTRHANGKALPDEERLTPFGNFLRRFSLDELPQLLNVIRGEVSFVGPRPLMHKYWRRDLYSPHQARRYEVKPGLTGWVQVNGRNSLSWEEKFDLDVWYVDNRSVGLDLQILARTLVDVLHGRGVNEDGYVTTSEFKGSSAKPATRSVEAGQRSDVNRQSLT